MLNIITKVKGEHLDSFAKRRPGDPMVELESSHGILCIHESSHKLLIKGKSTHIPFHIPG